MRKLDLTKVPLKAGSLYPEPYAEMMQGRSSLRLGQAAGLTQFGVNLVTLKPGALSSLRHWHKAEDEFIMVMAGECVLVTDAGEETMRQGDCVGFPAGQPDGHHLINRGDTPAVFLVIGSKAAEETVTYTDVDLLLRSTDGVTTFTHKDGRPYQPEGENNG
ncbi:cupin domain-containing protein [Xinfangfangia sp. CPCC 101601]|uniref:Cupin domain-containing protein n=1 Tax=Pseudogemmobacter lacusdianii TaxID=3069608 RepID=A0ABU0VYU4_9RHOB|nr:cupin domain-containing protein [Xinfangfangia sp. CPCC 101601]MDQ2066803.1 cupin domain-containing protein [Xinfangfangia sp. CPCC 101601]